MEINRELFEAHLFAQPRERTFIFKDGGNCLMCQFLRENTNAVAPCVTLNSFYMDWSDLPNWVGYLLPRWFLTLTATWRDADPLESFTYGQAQDRYLQLFPDAKPEQDESVVCVP